MSQPTDLQYRIWWKLLSFLSKDNDNGNISWWPYRPMWCKELLKRKLLLKWFLKSSTDRRVACKTVGLWCSLKNTTLTGIRTVTPRPSNPWPNYEYIPTALYRHQQKKKDKIPKTCTEKKFLARSVPTIRLMVMHNECSLCYLMYNHKGSNLCSYLLTQNNVHLYFSLCSSASWRRRWHAPQKPSRGCYGVHTNDDIQLNATVAKETKSNGITIKPN
jgi:hypothetical protein